MKKNTFTSEHFPARKDNPATNLNVLRKIAVNIGKHVDLSDVIKAKQLPHCYKHRLCGKRQDRL